MAQNTKTWSQLTNLVEARLGHDLSDKELRRVQALANDAADSLYLDTPWWERFLVLEPRTVERGYVAYEEDSYNVYGAGTSEVNGLYVRNGLSTESVAAYSKYDGDEITHSLIKSSSIIWEIVDGTTDGTGQTRYRNLSSEDTPPLDGWTVNSSAEEPAPNVQALSEIGEYIGHWNGAVFQCAGATPGTAYPDQNGIRITNCNASDVVYVAFKKTLDDVYGDGNLGTTSDIPAEWFNYMALQTAAAWDGAQDRPTVRAKDIDRAFDQALLKINRQGIYNNIASRFRTYYGCDVSVR